LKFHERFNIEIGAEEARRRFTNRAYNIVLIRIIDKLHWEEAERIKRNIVTVLGERYEEDADLEDYISDDFHKMLEGIEALYHTYENKKYVQSTIEQLLKISETDLGIRWEDGQFIRAGALLLDEKLVNDSLHWLSDKKYESVLKPFEKGLKHLLQSEKNPEFLADVITDMYESLEALAKIVTDRPTKDLSANEELFINKVNASKSYKRLLDDYIVYANEFRHGYPKTKSFI
jgi:hypothetical protein